MTQQNREKWQGYKAMYKETKNDRTNKEKTRMKTTQAALE
jgi:hypothetical protein